MKSLAIFFILTASLGAQALGDLKPKYVRHCESIEGRQILLSKPNKLTGIKPGFYRLAITSVDSDDFVIVTEDVSTDTENPAWLAGISNGRHAEVPAGARIQIGIESVEVIDHRGQILFQMTDLQCRDMTYNEAAGITESNFR